jgi:hypothetical protein
MTADEIAAIRSSFLRSIDEYAIVNVLSRTEQETAITYRFRLEEEWMDAQGLLLTSKLFTLSFDIIVTRLSLSAVPLSNPKVLTTAASY